MERQVVARPLDALRLLTEARVQRGWTVTQLSRESGVGRSTIDLIAGRQRGGMQLATMLDLADALGYRVVLERKCEKHTPRPASICGDCGTELNR